MSVILQSARTALGRSVLGPALILAGRPCTPEQKRGVLSLLKPNLCAGPMAPLARPAAERTHVLAARMREECGGSGRAWISAQSVGRAGEAGGRGGRRGMAGQPGGGIQVADLHQAAKEDDMEAAKRVLDAGGVNVDATDEDGRTPLILSCMSNNNQITKLLLKNGANPNAADRLGRTALHYCMPAGFSACVVTLYNNDADDKLRDAHGQTAGDLTLKNGNNY